jgi:hypothetical protein
MASLNIKNDEAYRLVHDLATLKGISLVAAVIVSVQEKLDREKYELERRNSRKGMAERLMSIARECAPLMNDGRTSKELMDDLYDEKGLPK